MSWLVLGALFLDLMFGDPRWIPHPVVLIGRLIKGTEYLVRKVFNQPLGLKIGGMLIVTIVCSITYLITWGILWLAGTINVYLGLVLNLWLLSTTLAVKSLAQHAMAVARPLAKGDLTEARHKLAMIVGRDTEQLNQREIARGTVETVAENTVDGIISPLFYAFLGGAPLAMTYKAINTMDSMIGHKDEQYFFLGWAAARLDDAANYFPARITAIYYLILAPFYPGGLKSVFKAICEDAKGHPSPNSGIPEAAMAALLGVQLGGTNYYQGEVSHRPFMGQEIIPLQHQQISQSLRITYLITLLALISGLLTSKLVTELLNP